MNKQIIWLASYPKSGNTWVRSFLISILFNKKKNFDLKDLNLINQYPSRRFFKNFINNPLDIHEVKKNWLITQDKINSDKKIKFFKTHNSLCNLDNYYFTNFKNSLGACKNVDGKILLEEPVPIDFIRISTSIILCNLNVFV